MIDLPSNEKDLVALFTGGNEAAYEKLYHLYSGPLLGYLLRFVKSETLAAEILQDSFVKVWNSKQSIDPEQCFRAYLFCIAKNLVYDFFRKAARDKKLRDELLYMSSVRRGHTEEDTADAESTRLLQDVIEALPPKRRQVFRLVKIEEISYEEVSGLLNISASTISDHIVKATKFVRERMGGYYTGLVWLVMLLHFF